MSTTWQGDLVELMVNKHGLLNRYLDRVFTLHISVTVMAGGHGSLHQAAVLLCQSSQPCPGVRGPYCVSTVKGCCWQRGQMTTELDMDELA